MKSLDSLSKRILTIALSISLILVCGSLFIFSIPKVTADPVDSFDFPKSNSLVSTGNIVTGKLNSNTAIIVHIHSDKFGEVYLASNTGTSKVGGIDFTNKVLIENIGNGEAIVISVTPQGYIDYFLITLNTFKRL